MSLKVSDQLLSQALTARNSNDEDFSNLVEGFLNAIRDSLPEYWGIYAIGSCSLQTRSTEKLGKIFRGFASTAMQTVMAQHFGYRMLRIGDLFLREEELKEISATDVAELVEQYPNGYSLLDGILQDALQIGVLVDGFVWDPAPGSVQEPDASTHYELLGILSDVRSKKILEDRNLNLFFMNCCSGFVVGKDLSDKGKSRLKRFTSVASQILNQAPDRQAFCC